MIRKMLTVVLVSSMAAMSFAGTAFAAPVNGRVSAVVSQPAPPPAPTCPNGGCETDDGVIVHDSAPTAPSKKKNAPTDSSGNKEGVIVHDGAPTTPSKPSTSDAPAGKS
jgi:hypothetical protein